jgi:ribosomal protein L9
MILNRFQAQSQKDLRKMYRKWDEAACQALEDAGVNFLAPGEQMNPTAGYSRDFLREKMTEELQRRYEEKRKAEIKAAKEREEKTRREAIELERENTRITMRFVMREVTHKYGITKEQLIGAQRNNFIVRIRHEFFYRAATETEASLPMIGQLCNRDHTTVMHGAHAHADRHGLPRYNEPALQKEEK